MVDPQTVRVTGPMYRGITLINKKNFDRAAGMVMVNILGQRINEFGTVLSPDEVKAAEKEDQKVIDDARILAAKDPSIRQSGSPQKVVQFAKAVKDAQEAVDAAMRASVEADNKLNLAKAQSDANPTNTALAGVTDEAEKLAKKCEADLDEANLILSETKKSLDSLKSETK